MSHHHLFVFLTRLELKACFALVWLGDTEDYGDEYPLRRYATEDAEETWEEGVRRAVRFLTLEHGVEFQGIQVTEDGNILATQEEPVEPNNMAYLEAFALGTMFDPRSALREGGGWLRKHATDLNIEPLVAAAADVDRQLQEVKNTIPQELVRHLDQRRREAVAAAGYGSLFNNRFTIN